MNVRVNITWNRGIYWICKRVFFYDRGRHANNASKWPTLYSRNANLPTASLDPVDWVVLPICWTREHIICSWYQNIVTRREVGEEKKNAFNESRSGGSRPVRRHIRGRLSRFSHDSGVIPNFPPHSTSQRGTDCPSSVNCEPRTHKGAGVFFISEWGEGGASKAAGQSLCTSFVKGGRVWQSKPARTHASIKGVAHTPAAPCWKDPVGLWAGGGRGGQGLMVGTVRRWSRLFVRRG